MRIIQTISIILITFVIAAGTAIPVVQVPKNWLEFTLVPGLEDKVRIIFFHVPLAWSSVLGFLFAMYYGHRYLLSKDFSYEIKSVSSAGIGMLFCLLATVTGSIWAKFTWGSFWNWDPRETSIFILLLIYGAYFALRSALGSEELRARLSATYAIIAGLTAPFFVFVMPRITGGLHPGTKGDPDGMVPLVQLHLPINMQIVLISGIIGFSLLFIWLLNLRVRIALVEHCRSKIQN